MSEQNTPRGVVVGTDGSDSSLAAVRWAAWEARMRRVPLSVVHVEPVSKTPMSTVSWPGGQVPDDVLDLQDSQAGNVIADALSAARDGVGCADAPDVHGARLAGPVVPALVDISRQAQLLATGCHGRTGKHRRLLGSVSIGLIHHAHCPVAVVHDEIPVAPRAARRPVLVGVDGSSASLAAAAIAFEEASWRGVDLLAVHVCNDVDMPASSGGHAAWLQAAAEDMLTSKLADLRHRYPGVAVHHVIRFEGPARQLLVQSERAQLIVVGSHGRGGFAGMVLGSVSTAVAQGAHVPVIITRHR